MGIKKEGKTLRKQENDVKEVRGAQSGDKIPIFPTQILYYLGSCTSHGGNRSVVLSTMVSLSFLLYLFAFAHIIFSLKKSLKPSLGTPISH